MGTVFVNRVRLPTEREMANPQRNRVFDMGRQLELAMQGAQKSNAQASVDTTGMTEANTNAPSVQYRRHFTGNTSGGLSWKGLTSFTPLLCQLLSDTGAQLSFVEFRDLNLPACQPVLQSMQRMSDSLDVPFSAMLAPVATQWW